MVHESQPDNLVLARAQIDMSLTAIRIFEWIYPLMMFNYDRVDARFFQREWRTLGQPWILKLGNHWEQLKLEKLLLLQRNKVLICKRYFYTSRLRVFVRVFVTI